VLAGVALTAALLAAVADEPAASGPEAGRFPSGAWDAWLESPGGPLRFGLELAGEGDGRQAWIVNGAERIAVPETTLADGTLVLDFTHYASRIEARVADGGERLDGTWEKRGSGGEPVRMEFHATAGAQPRFAAPQDDATEVIGDGPNGDEVIGGRWSVRFASEEEPAVGVFEVADDRTMVTGTFLTTTGDYRWLAGSVEGGRLRLSCFDGAHAFLLDATLGADGTLAGDFWSRDAWQDTWTATRDDDATLADGWSLVGAAADPALALHVFPWLDPKRTGDGLAAITEVTLTGYPLVIEVFGSWCPNCHDAGAFLAELRKRQPRVRVVGLAFELTGDRALDEPQVRRYLDRHGLRLDHLLLAGTASKARASQALPMLERVKAFPTLVLVDRAGRVRHVYTGFSGPGTGAAHERLTQEIEERVAALVAERPDATELESLLTASDWRDESDGSLVRFSTGDDDPDPWKRAQRNGTIEVYEALRFDRPTSKEPVRTGLWYASGSTLYTQLSDVTEDDLAPIEQLDWHLDRRAGVLLDARDFGHRLTPASRPRIPVLDGVGWDAPADLAAALAAEDPLWRREACATVALRVAEGELAELGFDPTPLVADPDTWVRCTAAWAAGHCKVEGARGALVAALGDGNPSVRREAARALAKLGVPSGDDGDDADDSGARAALEALAGDHDPLVRAAAAEALGR
jgi:thiol-disulfide isomerase/thioredoxin